MTAPTDILTPMKMIRRGALVAVSHSGGKDSQAMLAYLRALRVPEDQIVIFHADLGDVEWPGTLEHISATIGRVPLVKCYARRGLLQMVRERGMWPSPSMRQCTSDLKRGPITREIRRYLKAHPRFHGQVVSCMGLRADESSARSKRNPWRRHDGNSRAGRDWWEWLPIFNARKDEVFGMIAAAGQVPHPAYKLGMSRLSCRFCIMASVSDLTISARANPSLYARYCQIERAIGHTLSPSGRSLPAITGVIPAILA